MSTLPSGYPGEISPRRQALDRAVQTALYRTLRWFADHWLALVNTVAFIAVLLPTVAAPLLRLAGYDREADAIFTVYALTCHQMPSRSFFPWGEQMAMCHRMTAIHASFFVFGMLYVTVRRRFRPLPFYLMAAYSFPMAVDGFTQLFGWRESTWELRVMTGTLFGLAVVWYTFPHFELLMRIISYSLTRQLGQLRHTTAAPDAA